MEKYYVAEHIGKSWIAALSKMLKYGHDADFLVYCPVLSGRLIIFFLIIKKYKKYKKYIECFRSKSKA